MPQNLPKDLGSQDPITSAKLKALWANLPLNMGIPQLNGLSLQKGTVVFQPDQTLRITAGRSGVGLRGQISKLILDSLLNRDGLHVNGSMPLAGGQASVDTSPSHYGIHFSRPFLGGQIGLNANSDQGVRSYGIQYSRQF